MTTFILNGALFVLIGLELPAAARELSTDSAGHALLLVGAAYVTILATRYAFLNVSIGIIRLVDRRPSQRSLRTTHRGRVVSVVAGFRGAVSLAVALSVPESLPGRDIVVFVTGLVVFLTLVLQGLALPVVIRWARLPRDSSVDDELRLARVTATQEALDALPELGRVHEVDDDVVEQLAQQYEEGLAVLQTPEDGSGSKTTAARRRDLSLDLIARKRAAVVRLRDENTIDDTVLREIQAQLDAEEIRLLGPPVAE